MAIRIADPNIGSAERKPDKSREIQPTQLICRDTVPGLLTSGAENVIESAAIDDRLIGILELLDQFRV